LRNHRLFAWLMHHVVHPLEPPPLRALRRELARRAFGRVLEVGAGDGALLGLYDPARVETVLALEPDGAMLSYLHREAARHPLPVRVLAGTAEALPLGSQCVDCVVYSLVLCSVDSVGRALEEARRVLRPAGRLLFLEHVASPAPVWQKAQRRITPVWRRIAAGCHLDRDPLAEAERAGFRVQVLQRWGGRLQPFILVEGRLP
jgi:ubiquinone/menaquinone biosynthesis C-methylase UbiE